jgi:regulator of protease activity HflC (stomatin/prohibitin superfamily)
MRRALMTNTSYHVFAAEPTGRLIPWGRQVVVNQWEHGLLFRHGRFERVLAPGGHRFWSTGFTLRAVDLRPWIVQLPAQEVPTADGATVKVTVAGQARVTDAAAYVTGARDAEQALYLAVQVALRELVAGTTVDDLLTGRADVGSRLRAGVRGLDRLGVTVEQLELKDIILPGELKRAQAAVLVARTQGMASLERARGENAALRSLANAARMVADNPALLHLRLVQQLEVSTGHTVVIGSPPLGAGVTTGAPAAEPVPAARAQPPDAAVQ